MTLRGLTLDRDWEKSLKREDPSSPQAPAAGRWGLELVGKGVKVISPPKNLHPSHPVLAALLSPIPPGWKWRQPVPQFPHSPAEVAGGMSQPGAVTSPAGASAAAQRRARPHWDMVEAGAPHHGVTHRHA